MSSLPHTASHRFGAAVPPIDRDAMVRLLSDTVRQASISGHEDRVSETYVRFFDERGWDVEKQVLAGAAVAETETGRAEPRLGDRANVVGWYRRNRGRPTLVINGHIDVVPVHDENKWTRPPFSGEIAEGHVHGRGSVDTKGGIAAALFALDACDRAGVEFPFDIAVELVVAEETTGVGTRASLERLPQRLGTIVLEPTDNAIVPLASGLLFFTVKLSGRAAHTSVPWFGIDAAPRLIRIYHALTALGEQRAQTHTHPRIPLPSAVPLAIGTLQAGGWRASVPAEAALSGRVGVLPGEELQDVRDAVVACVREATAGDEHMAENPAEILWDHDGSPSWQTADDEPVVRHLVEGRRRAGLPPRVEGITAGCDAGTLVAAGIPTVVFGPGHMRYAHSPNERIAVADVAAAAEVLRGALLSWGESA